MRLWYLGIVAALWAACLGCTPEVPLGGTILDPILTPSDKPSTASGSDEPALSGPVVLRDTVTQSDGYKLFSLGQCAAGQRWTVAADGVLSSSFLVVLLDENYDLLQRAIVSSASPLEHITRGTTAMYVGVAPSFGRNGGDFRFTVRHSDGVGVPSPRSQVVWVNFGGGTNVKVHAASPATFPAFSGSLLGGSYDGKTAELKSAILNAMYEDYAGYNIVILSSDDGAPPAGAYSTLHIGAYDERLLGLADSVDQYNQNLSQTAIIYAESFADFAVMRLTPTEMGQMIGNVASHELGHLLGLFHTQVPTDVMDTTGTAWDLADNQTFIRAQLEETVFPFGNENSPARLAETLGQTNTSGRMKPLSTADALREAEIRALARQELTCGCGTCLHLDD